MMKRKTKIWLLIASVTLIGIASTIAVFFSGKWHSSNDKTTKVSLRLAWIPGATFAGDYIAFQNGYWKDNGLSVTVNPGGFEHDAIKLVAGGADTFGVSSGPQILQARANGVPVVAIGAVIPRSPIGWVARINSGITKPQDFVGKKVGAEFGTHTEITFEALCAKLHIDLKTLDRVPIKFDPKPFIAGTIDVLPVYIIDQPIDLTRQGIDLTIIDPADYGVSLAYGNVYFTTEEMVLKRPDIVRKFLAGARRGWIWSHQHRERTADILADYCPGSDKKILLAKIDAVFDFIQKSEKEYLGVFPMNANAWDDTLRIMQKYGNLEGNVDVERCFTNVFLENTH